MTFSSLVQSRVPEDLRGRAFAGLDVLWQTGRMLSLLGGGLLADAVGIQAVYLLGGLLLLAAAAVGAVGARAAARGTEAPATDSGKRPAVWTEAASRSEQASSASHRTLPWTIPRTCVRIRALRSSGGPQR